MNTIDQLKPDPRNARKRTERSATLIGESLKRYGAARSIVIDEDDRILAGNGTVEQARAAGITNVRIVETDGDEIIAVRRKGLTDQDKIGLAIADNRTSDLSEWDAEMLRQLDAEYDLTPWFFEDEIPVEEVVPPEGLTDPDDVPEVPEAPITKPGDLYILGNHRLLCGDATDIKAVERLMDGQKAVLSLTDPPYGVSYADKNAFLNSIDNGNRNQTPIKNDHLDKQSSQVLWREAFTSMCVAMDAGAAFYCFMPQGGDQMMMMMMMMEAGIEPRHELMWLKNNHVLGRTDYAYKHEPILYAWKAGGHKFYGGFKTSVLEFSRPGSSKVHPTMKPVDLLAELIGNSSKPEQIVLDLFGGSGSTLIACERLCRHCRLMELDPAYCDVIVKRWENYTGNTALLHREDGA